MRRFELYPSVLQDLRCPTCATPIISQSPEPFEFGKVRCACSEYPVIAGVVLLNHRPLHNALLAAIDAGEWLMLESMVCQELRVPKRLLQRRADTFLEAIDCYVTCAPNHVTSEFEWLLHAKYWDATAKHLAALRLTSFISSSSYPTVLDLACGFGHLTRLYQQVLCPRRTYMLDRELLHLILAASLLPPGRSESTCRVAMEVQDQLPLAPRSVDLILNSDAFYAFENQHGTLRSCREILAEKGRVLFTHLHNCERLDEPFQLNSHNRHDWQALFERNLGIPVNLMSDEALRDSLFSAQDLSILPAPTDQPRSFTVLAPVIEKLTRFTPELDPLLPLRFNRIYDVCPVEGSFRLSRRRLSRLFETEHEPCRFFPDLTLPESDLRDRHRRNDLFRRAILVPS